MVRFAALRDRYLEDRLAGGASPRLADALTAIGWGAVQEPTSEEVAEDLVEMVDACVTDHHDPDLLIAAIARLLREYGPHLDGGLPPVEAYEPAALEVLERYIRDEPTRSSEPRE